MLLLNHTVRFIKLHNLKKELLDSADFLPVFRHPLNIKIGHVMLFGYYHACLGMPKVLGNNKSPVSMEKN